MAGYTDLLNLYFKNPLTDGADNFNIETMLNQNWRKIDEALGPLLPLSILPVKSATSEDGNLLLELAVEPVSDTDAITLVAFQAPDWPSNITGFVMRYPSAATGEVVDEAYTFTDSGLSAIGDHSFGNQGLLAVALYPAKKKAYLINPLITGWAKSNVDALDDQIDSLGTSLSGLEETVADLKRVYTGSRSGTGTSSISLVFDKTPSIIMYFSDTGGNASGFFVLRRNSKSVKFYYQSGDYMQEANISPDVTWGKTVIINFSALNEFSASRFNSTLCDYDYVAFT